MRIVRVAAYRCLYFHIEIAAVQISGGDSIAIVCQAPAREWRAGFYFETFWRCQLFLRETAVPRYLNMIDEGLDASSISKAISILGS